MSEPKKVAFKKPEETEEASVTEPTEEVVKKLAKVELLRVVEKLPEVQTDVLEDDKAVHHFMTRDQALEEMLSILRKMEKHIIG